MTIKSRDGEFLEGPLERWETRRKQLLSELAGVEAAISAIKSYCHASEDGGFWKDLHLDGLQTTDAVVTTLSYADKRGKPKLSVGEIRDILRRFEVTTSRRQGRSLFRDSAKPRVALGQAIRGYRTRKKFETDRPIGERLQDGDMVWLANPPK